MYGNWGIRDDGRVLNHSVKSHSLWPESSTGDSSSATKARARKCFGRCNPEEKFRLKGLLANVQNFLKAGCHPNPRFSRHNFFFDSVKCMNFTFNISNQMYIYHVYIVYKIVYHECSYTRLRWTLRRGRLKCHVDSDTGTAVPNKQTIAPDVTLLRPT